MIYGIGTRPFLDFIMESTSIQKMVRLLLLKKNNDLDTMISLGMYLYVDVSIYLSIYVCMYVSHLSVHLDH